MLIKVIYLIFLVDMIHIAHYSVTTMKNTKRSKLKTTKQAAAPAQPVAGTPPIPEPQSLIQEALTEPRVVAARDYLETINILRDKKSFSFRQIAAWFNERGVPLDNNDIYRAYMANVDPMEKEMMTKTTTLPDPED